MAMLRSIVAKKWKLPLKALTHGYFLYSKLKSKHPRLGCFYWAAFYTPCDKPYYKRQ